ncbi:hypothetical protein [Leptolyngbya sp. FACHB-8]|uniref:hypothetical protein n=1 Tax=unclassified Leptolyngbya TaxID=2650499 RepID=UPI001686DF18|nr:hypothetical protein [Leptolyngbya sp. FACHB-8]MBD1910277.1 hypothetical protein [Leptolyngbya sp. FACHB-8]
MTTTTRQTVGSVVDAPESIKRAIAADPAKAKLWEELQTKTFEELAWGIFERGGLVR